MISIEEAQELMTKFIMLKKEYDKSKDHKDFVSLRRHEELCIKKFHYLITMRTDRYKSFANYEDLNQEGCVALMKAMKNYNPEKGIFFWWAHKYIDTRVSRSANTHSVIKYPLSLARTISPRRENKLPTMVEDVYCPDKQAEKSELRKALNNAINGLSKRQQKAVSLIFGLSDDDPLSITRVSKKMKMSREKFLLYISKAMSKIETTIKI